MPVWECRPPRPGATFYATRFDTDDAMDRALTLLQMLAVGALLGGLLGDVFGLRAAIAAGMAEALLPPLWLILTPVRTLRRTPMPVAVDAGGEFAS